MENASTVVIVGRINVGKSTLFNRLTETKRALVSPIAGTTRDYNIGVVDWQGKSFELIDTGGVNITELSHSIASLLPGKKIKIRDDSGIIEQAIIRQTKNALQKADLVMMVVDSKAGMMSEDRELAIVLKKIGKPIMLVCNKTDNQRARNAVHDFHSLGLGTPYPVSAANSSGIGDFLDDLVKRLTTKTTELREDKQETIKVAIIGKPNTGKSSLVNKILGEERVIVTDIPGTTREPQDTTITYESELITLIDTAGLRKKAKIGPGLEHLATTRTRNMIKYADVIIFVTEVSEHLTRQDSYLAALIKENRPGIIIVSNKFDLLDRKGVVNDRDLRMYYQRAFPHVSFAPLLFVSAHTGRNVEKILSLVLEVTRNRRQIIPQEELDKILVKLLRRHHPAQAKGAQRPQIQRLTQSWINPPAFTLSVGPRQSLHFSYLRFIENQLREQFNFSGVPLKVEVRASHK